MRKSYRSQGWVVTVALAMGFLIALVIFPSDSTQHQSHKKLIYYGWGTRDTIYVRQRWHEMEQMPFDGIGITVAIDRNKPTTGDGATGNLLGWHIFGPKAFRLEDFRPAIDDLKVPKWERFKDNFLPACICSSGQDFGFNWFDDGRWKTIVNNWQVLVTIAKDGGCKGILIDPEPYGAPFWHYPSMRQRMDSPFPEYVAKVRQRGRDLMEVTRKIFPDISLLFLVGPSHMLHYKEPLEEQGYGLLAAFLDGLMEAADERAKFVDLCEMAYGYKSRDSFLQAYHWVKNKAMRFSLLPELYRAKVRVGFGLMLDCLSHRQGWHTQDFSKNYFSPEAFQQSLQMALELTDEYVWIYSQVPKFFPPEHLPEAYLKAMERAREAIR